MLKVFNKYYQVRNLLFFLVESGLIILGIWSGIYLLYSGEVYYDPEKLNIWARILLITLLIQISLYYHDLYNFRLKSRMTELGVRIVSAIGFACLGLAALYYLFPFLVLEQGVLFLGLFILGLFMVSWRLLYQVICQKKIWNEKILLVGDGNLASLIGEEVNSSQDVGYTLSAVFSNPGKSGLAERLGVDSQTSYDRLCEYALANRIKKIVVALEERRGHSPVQALLNCKMHGIKIIDGLSFYETLSGKILATSTPPSWLIFSDGFRRYNITLWSKRAVDICLALVGLLFSAPLFLAVAVLVKTTSQGGMFFCQTRVGQRGQNFQIIKLRTMCHDAEDLCGAVWASKNDSRVTHVGRVLRKFRLDEFPQFWNVLKGEMSLVGPRPERPEFVGLLKQKFPYYNERHTVKPGITGWAQINYGYGASEEDALRKLEYDLFYIKNLSLVFDLYIVLKTVKIVLVSGGAR